MIAEAHHVDASFCACGCRHLIVTLFDAEANPFARAALRLETAMDLALLICDEVDVHGGDPHGAAPAHQVQQ